MQVNSVSSNIRSIGFGQETQKPKSDTAATMATLAVIGSAGALITSGLLLRKASQMEKAAKPILEGMDAANKIIAPLKKFVQDTGLDKVGAAANDVFDKALGIIGNGIKKLTPMFDDISKETDAAKLEELNAKLSNEVIDILKKALPELDDKAVAHLGNLAETPIGKFFMAGEKLNPPGRGIKPTIQEFAQNSKTLQHPIAKTIAIMG